MIKEVKHWICTKCGYIQYTSMDECPACSNNKAFNRTGCTCCGCLGTENCSHTGPHWFCWRHDKK